MNKPQRTAGLPPSPLSGDRVATWLRRHPDFLADRPDLAAILTPPAVAGTDNHGGPIDFGRFLVQRLQRDLAAARDSEIAAIDNARRLIQQQERVHEACLALIDARSFEHFVEAIATDVAVMLQLDAVALCIEAREKQPKGRTRSGVNLLPIGTVNALLGGEDKTDRRRELIRAERRLYGGAAALIQSDLLIRLRVSSIAPASLLALGGRDPATFREKTSLPQFFYLARVIESTARAWLNAPK
ncbi:MAG: DUF484 family protein [Rhodospirillaceae bacterium]|nr:DUF484 family protein [Rhodospirillaceae bacterium]